MTSTLSCLVRCRRSFDIFLGQKSLRSLRLIKAWSLLMLSLIRAYVWRRYFCRKLARDLKVLKILFCTRLYGFVPSSISSGCVRSYNRSQLKSVRKQVTIYIICNWNGKEFLPDNLFSINPWNPLIRTCTSTTEQRNVHVTSETCSFKFLSPNFTWPYFFPPR